MSDKQDDIDWSLTTWEGSRRAQLRHALTLTLRERLEAAEGMADIARRFEEMRERGEFTIARPDRPEPRAESAPAAREPARRCDSNE